MNNNTRIPVSPLEYNSQNITKAIPGEMLIDYTNAYIYIKQKTYPYKITNVTSKIISIVSGMDGNNLVINIGELGLYELQGNTDTLLNVLKTIIDRTKSNVTIEPYNNFSRICGQEVKVDNESIKMDNRTLQVGNFSDAQNGAIPIKTDVGIKWSDANTIRNLINGNNNNSDAPSITEENPIDGMEGTIVETQPDNNIINLKASLKQITTNLRTSAKIQLPATLDNFSEIQWCITTTNYVPILTFEDNVIWVYGQSGEAHKAIPNAFIVYKFQTWDFGAHWLAERRLYSSTYNYEGVIDEAYLNEHYYDKEYIDDKLSWLRK